MSSYLGLDRVFKAFRIIRHNGGIVPGYKKLYRMDEVKDGKLVGEDKYGNKYYENPYYFYGRNRWVEYAPHFHLEYDGSQTTARTCPAPRARTCPTPPPGRKSRHGIAR